MLSFGTTNLEGVEELFENVLLTHELLSVLARFPRQRQGVRMLRRLKEKESERVGCVG